MSKTKFLHIRNTNLILEDRYVITKSEINPINVLREELSSLVTFQKNFHIGFLKSLDSSKKNEYLGKLRNFFEPFYKGNQYLLEQFENHFDLNLLSESNFDHNEYVNKMFSFFNYSTSSKSYLNENILFSEINLLNEMDLFSNAWDATVNATKSAYNYVSNQLSNAINYVKKNGINLIMEQVRSALVSGAGAAIQTALGFTGVGNIGNAIAWGIMTLYDAYQYFINSGSIMNFVVSVLSLVLSSGGGGALLTSLKPFFGAPARGISGVLQSFNRIKSLFQPVMNFLKSAATWLSSSIKNAVTFMVEKMGCNWIQTIGTRVTTFFDDLVNQISTWIGGALVKLQGRAWLQKIGGSMYNKFNSMAKDQVNKWLGKKIKKEVLQQIDNQIGSMKESTSTELLSYIDKNFGNNYAEIYAEFLNEKSAFDQLKSVSAQRKRA
jgi:hypothetical protein